MSYKLIVGADIGEDNGVFNGGIFSTVEDAIAYEQTEFAYKYHEFYGASVVEVGSQKVVAESNGYWKGSGENTVNWHCKLALPS